MKGNLAGNAGRNTPWLHLLPATALVIVFLFQTVLANRSKSTTSDEPPHIAAGLSYLETGVFRANPEHPPLLKELSALSLVLAGIHWPKTPEATELIKGPLRPYGLPEWERYGNIITPIGNRIITENGPDKVMFWARLPLILLAALLAIIVYAWGRGMVGESAALGALFLFAFDPTILAHSGLVTTDVGVAAFTMCFLFALWKYVCFPSWKRLLLTGLMLGTALGAKFSAIALPPLCGLLLLAASRWPPEGNSEAPWIGARSRARTGPNDLCPCGSGRKFKKCHGTRGKAATSESTLMPALYRSRVARSGMVCFAIFLVAIVVVQALYFFSTDPLLYVRGLEQLQVTRVPDFQVFLGGCLYPLRLYGYFAVAYLLKEPLASIVLVGVGLVAVMRSKAISVLQKLFLLVPPAVLFAGYTLRAENIGIRYIIPVLPFAFLLGGVGLAALIRSGSVWRKALGAALCVWIVAAAAGIYPDHLSYFNEAACLFKDPHRIGLDGGTRCGPMWLDDSNVDWGQGMKQLKVWLDRHAPGRTIHLLQPFGIRPEAYGVIHKEVEDGEIVRDTPPHELYVASAHFVARVPALVEKSGQHSWLGRIPPTAIVGHSLYVYDFSQDPKNP